MAARLGCAERYKVAVHMRGGGTVWTWVHKGITELRWGRKRDDWSEARIVVAKKAATSGCCDKLGHTRTWGHELSIYRDTDTDPAWQGPIVDKVETRNTIEFTARDMLAWFDRRAINPPGAAPAPGQPDTRQYWWPNPTDTGAILRTIIHDAFPAGDPIRDPGLRAYTHLLDTGTLSTTDHLWHDTQYVGEVVRDLVAAGVDFYTVGRHIYLHSDKITAAPYRLTDGDFLDDLEVRESGLDAQTRGLLIGAQPLDAGGTPIQDVAPVVGRATLPPGDAVLAFYGQIDKLGTSMNTTDRSVANGIAGAQLAYGSPPPVDLVVPDGARLSPKAPVTIGQLIPGRPFVVSLTGYCTPVQQTYRLNELEVRWGDGEVEEVAVSLASNGPAVQIPNAA